MASHRDRGRGFGTIGAAVVIAGLLIGGVFVASKLVQMPFSTTTKDHSAPPVLLDLTNLADYHGAQAQFQVTLDQEQDVRWIPSFIAGERVQFIAVGTVDATVDFTNLSDGAIVISDDGTAATITLPRATAAEPVLDLELSHVMNRDRGVVNRVGGLFTDNPTSEHELMLSASDRIAEAAAATDLLNRAEDNVKSMLYTMLRNLGFTSVDIRFDGSPAQPGGASSSIPSEG